MIADDPPRSARHCHFMARRLTAITALTPARTLHFEFQPSHERDQEGPRAGTVDVQFPPYEQVNPRSTRRFGGDTTNNSENPKKILKILASSCEGQGCGQRRKGLLAGHGQRHGGTCLP